MIRGISRLWLGVAVIALTSCSPGSGNWVGGIEGSGVRDILAVTSSGAVTELGSIIVNGVKYDLTGASITLDGRPVRDSDLGIGSVVLVEGTLDPGGATGRATRVTAGTAVAGPIDSVGITGDSFVVLGQTVGVDLATVIEGKIEGQALGGLKVGSDVVVSGFADSSGTIMARRIAPRGADRSLLVTGHVTALDTANRRFAMNGTIVDYASARLIGFDSLLADGAPVRVVATDVDASGVISADEVEYRDLRIPGAAGDTAVVQGWVTRYESSSDFDVDGRRVVAMPDSTVSGAVSLDSFVSVRGQLTGAGAIDIRELLNSPPPKIWINDVNGNPIQGAVVTITIGVNQYVAATNSLGIATFATLPTPTGWATVSISAPGFDTVTYTTGFDHGIGQNSFLDAVGAWKIGTPIVLGTRFIDRASDGSMLSFSVDLAVIDGNSEAIQTLTSADFSLGYVDCGWGDGRDCASDANGNATGSWWQPGEHPRSFLGLQVPMARSAYQVEALAVRSDRYDWRTYTPYWETLAPALKSFVAEVGSSDRLSLSSVQIEDGAVTHAVLGPFTSDGTIYFDAIDEIGQAAGHDWPPIVQSLNEAILRAAAVRDQTGSAAEPSVLVLGPPWLEVEEVNAVTASAQQHGVRISVLNTWPINGVHEIAVRTGGFVAETFDARQFSMIFGAMDRLLAGTVPFYRMEFQLAADPGTFVAGGNAKVRIRINVPTSLPYRGLEAIADVAIP